MAKRTKDENENEKRRLDLELDRELEATFPASDALKITRPGPKVSVGRDGSRSKRT
jgi:hypothetical protein